MFVAQILIVRALLFLIVIHLLDNALHVSRIQNAHNRLQVHAQALIHVSHVLLTQNALLKVEQHAAMESVSQETGVLHLTVKIKLKHRKLCPVLLLEL
jgi:hypothetical protein